ncbi:hypothetical protein SAMN02800691_2130 [Luteibacter sp. UNCMF366Tsu5.1]|nr:hypothetical protein SAMN02800691_2130 [Luteibacter sp. UNCMF366Tsu5.1]
MRWRPHTDKDGKQHPLYHLHPFRYEVVMPAKDGRPETVVAVHVGFGMHCFTKKVEKGDDPSNRYADDREERTFDFERYEHSKRLRTIARELQQRQCAFAKNENFVCLDLTDANGERLRYGVFFNIKKWAGQGRGDNAVLLVIQSAYCLDPKKPDPCRGKIRFNVLLGHALRGTTPTRPKR